MALPAVFFGVPMIYHYHSAELKLAAQSKLSNFFFAQSLSWARAHVANSSYTASLVKKLNAKLKVEIIAYGAPIKFLGSKGLSALGAEHEAGKRPCKNLLFVGRHIERKGIRYLIEAMKLLSEEFTLTIVGEGDLTEKLKEQTRNEKVDARVIFAGRLSSEELTKAYQTHDVFVLPAIVDTKGDTEGLGVVLIEAIAVGLPIVATNVGGIVDVIIDGETGMLVEEKNPQALAEAIKKMSADEILAQKLITGARKRAAEFFSWDKVLEKTIEVYKEASNKS
jgi:glycosyltransferase involved in cell wall biosynthesis